MGACRKRRLDRLCAGVADAEDEAVDRRSMLRFETVGCRLIRDAMWRAGVDPSSSPALREVEERVAGFADKPELQAADEAFRDAQRRRNAPDPEDEAATDALVFQLDRVGRRYAESGTLPNFREASFLTLLGWATPPEPVGADAE